jgi:hypothetical protein
MQNIHTGELVPFHAKFLEGIPVQEFGPLFDPVVSPGLGARVEELRSSIQAAKDAAIPVRIYQGPVFFVGQELEIMGGRFRVHAITRKRLYLDSLPRVRDHLAV